MFKINKFYFKYNMDEEICNICSDVLKMKKEEDLQILKCGHRFCYNCILEWYKTLINKINYGFRNYDLLNECPTCRRDGGYLKLRDGEKYIQYVHGKLKKHQLNTNLCSAPLLDGVSNCKRKGNAKYGFYCFMHKNFEKENPKKLTNKQKNQVELVKNNIKIKLEKKKCEALCKNGEKCKKYARKGFLTCYIHNTYFEDLQKCNTMTKNGKICKNKGKEEFNGNCGIHKNLSLVYPKKLVTLMKSITI